MYFARCVKRFKDLEAALVLGGAPYVFDGWQQSFCSSVTGVGRTCCQQEIPDASAGSAFASSAYLDHVDLLFLSIIWSSTLCSAPSLLLGNHTGEWVCGTSGEGSFDKSQVWLISSLTLKYSSFNNSFLLQVQGLLYLNKLKYTLHTSKDHALNICLNTDYLKIPQGFGLLLSHEWWDD